MKSYTVLSKDINKYRVGKNKNTDILLYAYIKLCSNFKTGISNATQQKLHELSGIKLRTIQSSISRLRETNLFKIKTKFEGIKKMNIYHFELNPPNFFFVNNSFYYADIEIKEKGFLLLIKSLCINNTNVTLYNRKRIAELLSQDRGTVSKMINNLIQKNMIVEIEKGFVLPANYFPFYPKDEQSVHKYESFNSFDEFILDSLIDHCNCKGSVLFVSDLHLLKVIFAHYPITNRDIASNESNEVNSLFLPFILKKRCKTLPSKIESLLYFIEVLNIDVTNAGSKEECSFIF